MPEDEIEKQRHEFEVRRWEAEHRQQRLESQAKRAADADRWRHESALGRREIALKEADHRLRSQEFGAARWRSPLIVAILAAAVAAIGNASVAYLNGTQTRALEEQKAEAVRVLEMIKVGDTERAAANLDFLLQSGLIADEQRSAKIREFLNKRKPGEGPSTGQPASESSVQIREIQRALTTAGCYRGALDGHIGPMTRLAISAFMRATDKDEAARKLRFGGLSADDVDLQKLLGALNALGPQLKGACTP